MIRKSLKIILISAFISIIFLNIYGYSKTKIENVVNNKEINAKILKHDNYFAILEIPKINLKKELYQDEKNNVDQNIYVHPKSIFPNQNKSHVILASHSGSSSIAYFKNLYKLKVNDEVKLYYNQNIYIYNIKEIEYQAKTGTLYLKQDYSNLLTLITCTYQNNKTQTIYYAKLTKITKI